MHEGRYLGSLGAPLDTNMLKITIHLNERAQKWDPKQMREVHEKAKEALIKFHGFDGLCPKCGGGIFVKNTRGLQCRNPRCGHRIYRTGKLVSV